MSGRGHIVSRPRRRGPDPSRQDDLIILRAMELRDRGLPQNRALLGTSRTGGWLSTHLRAVDRAIAEEEGPDAASV